MALLMLAWLALAAGYDGPMGYWQGGDSWTGLCATGIEQSPIALSTASSTVVTQGQREFKLLRLNYGSDTLQSHISGSDFVVNGNFGFISSSDESTDEDFTADVDKVVFKAPAEHVVEGVQADVEMQVFHRFRGAPEQLVGLVVHFQISDEADDNSFIASLLSSVSSPQSINLADAFTGMLELYHYFTYSGSLTVPPCTERVMWYIWAYPQPISREQAAYFSKLWQGNPGFAGGMGNNRNLQSVYGREVIRFVGDQSDLATAGWVGLAAAALWAGL